MDLLVRRGFDDLAWPADHFVQRSSRSDHWIYRVFLFHPKVDQDWAIMLPRGSHGRYHLGSLGDRHAMNSVGLAEFRKIRIEQRSGGIVPLVEEFLPLTHHSEEPVIDDRDVDLELL